MAALRHGRVAVAAGPLTQGDLARIVEDIRAGRYLIPARLASEWGIHPAEARGLLDQHRPQYRAKAL